MPAAFHQLDEILGHWLCAVNHEALSLSDEEEEYDDEDGDDSDDSVVSFFFANFVALPRLCKSLSLSSQTGSE